MIAQATVRNISYNYDFMNARKPNITSVRVNISKTKSLLYLPSHK